MAENNTLNEWSDGEDDWIFEINENNMIGEEANVDDSEWCDPEGDDIIRNMNVDDIKQGVGRNVKATSHCYRKKTFTK